MASSQEYHDYVLELLAGVDGIRTRKMMGEYIVYLDDVVVGGIYDDLSCCSSPSSVWTRCSRMRSAGCPTKARRR